MGRLQGGEPWEEKLQLLTAAMFDWSQILAMQRETEQGQRQRLQTLLVFVIICHQPSRLVCKAEFLRLTLEGIFFNAAQNQIQPG